MSAQLQFISSLLLIFIPQILTQTLGPVCDNDIYCYGPILDKAQNCKIYPDSKTFVDLKMINPPVVTKAKFQALMDANAQNPTCAQITQFVNQSFVGPDIEFQNWTPSDWKASPAMLNTIRYPPFKQFASNLNAIWKDLGRQIIADVEVHQDQYSLIYVKNPFIVPGGRFREFYYWDSFWIIKGLIQSEMFTTAKGMLYNFKSIIDRYGFIPNGGRVYYTKRSQPPLYAMMCEAYVDATGDIPFAKEVVPSLEKEYLFWEANHTVSVLGYNFFVYGDKSTGPRPESYREDIATASFFKTEAEKQEAMSELKAAAESGMDFSSRWFINPQGTNVGNLTNLKTRSIVPVDLNAYLHRAAKIISKFYTLGDQMVKSATYLTKAQKIVNGMLNVLYDNNIGIWLDYDLTNNKRREYFVASNLVPLFTGSYDATKSQEISDRAMKYINNSNLLSYPGGIPNTLCNTGEQWDFPNIWPPMLHMIIMGMENLGTVDAKNLALNLANRWVASNYQAYVETQSMFEKYNAEKFAGHGSGGEYGVQLGFGWTNGALMDLLGKYGPVLPILHPL